MSGSPKLYQFRSDLSG